MPSNRYGWKRILKVLTAFVAFYILVDSFLMPLYTRRGQTILVPNVTDLSFEEAEKLLKGRGLRAVRAAERFDARVAPGHVLSQEPKAGSQVKRGRRVYLTLSKGERTVTMPNLVGGSERDARFRLSSLGLLLQEVVYEHSSYYPEGVVADQSIPAQSQVEVGTPVRLTVSLGPLPSQFIVPSLVGKSLEEARRELRKAGLTLGRIEYQMSRDLLPETVIAQSIPPGRQVAAGDSVDLVISQYPHE